MEKYRVSLARSYVVTIEAESEEKSCMFKIKSLNKQKESLLI